MNGIPSVNLNASMEFIIAKAWADPVFKAWLKEDPRAALSDIGVEVDDGVEVEVVEETAQKLFLPLPVSPAPETINFDELEAITADGQSGDLYTQWQPHSCSTGANCSC